MYNEHSICISPLSVPEKKKKKKLFYDNAICIYNLFQNYYQDYEY